MKVLHLGDLHIGKSLLDYDLIEDQRYILKQIIEIAKENKIDAILLAGDIYDRSIPSEAAVNLLDEFLTEVSDLKIAVFMISGNHDSDDRLQFGSQFFEKKQVYIEAKFRKKIRKVTLQDAYGPIHFHLLPFVKASQVKQAYPDEKIESYEEAFRVLLSHCDINTSERNVMIAHQFVAGKGTDPALAGSEGIGTQSVGTVEKIGYDVFSAYDYVALGHIHSPQQVGRAQVRYAGSMLKYSLSEVHNKKSVPIVTFGEKGDVSIELVELKPLRDLRHIKGTLEQLLNPTIREESEDFIYVTLTNEEMVLDAMSIFQQFYPNTVKIDYDNSHTMELEEMDFTNFESKRTFEELIADFYQTMYGCEISKEELKLMQEVAKEAGIIDETN